MDAAFLKRIYNNLVDRKTNLTAWVEESTPTEVEMLSAADPQAVEAEIHSIECCIESVGESSYGICTVCKGTIERELLELDYTASVCLDDYSEQEKRRLESELEFSRAIQRASLPQLRPSAPDLEMAAFSRPAQIVSGDFFDFFSFQDGSQGIAIADAVGHGVSAGMLMSSVQTALRLLAPEVSSPVPILERINRLLMHNINFTTFVTLFLGSYDPLTRQLTYANAGHNPPLLFQAEHKSVARLYPTGAAVGLIEGFSAQLASTRLAAGDVLFLYTDGLTEAQDGQGGEFGVERLTTLVQAQAAAPAADLVGMVRRDLEGFLAGRAPEDDITFVAIKAN